MFKKLICLVTCGLLLPTMSCFEGSEDNVPPEAPKNTTCVKRKVNIESKERPGVSNTELTTYEFGGTLSLSDCTAFYGNAEQKCDNRLPGLTPFLDRGAITAVTKNAPPSRFEFLGVDQMIEAPAGNFKCIKMDVIDLDAERAIFQGDGQAMELFVPESALSSFFIQRRDDGIDLFPIVDGKTIPPFDAKALNVLICSIFENDFRLAVSSESFYSNGGGPIAFGPEVELCNGVPDGFVAATEGHADFGDSGTETTTDPLRVEEEENIPQVDTDTVVF